MKKQVNAIELLDFFAGVVKQQLHIDNSLIPLNILITVASYATKNEELTVKALFTRLPYSTMGVRNHFNRLLTTGWIKLEQARHDKRIKTVKPTLKLFDKLVLIEDELGKYF